MKSELHVPSYPSLQGTYSTSAKRTAGPGGINDGENIPNPAGVVNLNDGDGDDRQPAAPAFANKHSPSLAGYNITMVGSASAGGTAAVNVFPFPNEQDNESPSPQPLGGPTAASIVSEASQGATQGPHSAEASTASNDHIGSEFVLNVGARAQGGVVNSDECSLQNRLSTRPMVRGDGKTRGVERQTFATADDGGSSGARSRPLNERAVWITAKLRAGVDHNLSLSEVTGPNRAQEGSTICPAERSLERSQHLSKRLSSAPRKGEGGGASPTRFRSEHSWENASAASSAVASSSIKNPSSTSRSMVNQTANLARNDNAERSVVGQIRAGGEKQSSDRASILPVEDVSDNSGTDNFAIGSRRNMLTTGGAPGGNRRQAGLRAKPWETARRWVKGRKGRDDGRVRVKAFDLLVEIYKEQQREVCTKSVLAVNANIYLLPSFGVWA